MFPSYMEIISDLFKKVSAFYLGSMFVSPYLCAIGLIILPERMFIWLFILCIQAGSRTAFGWILPLPLSHGVIMNDLYY